MNTFKAKTEIRFGADALQSLADFHAKSAVIITDSFFGKVRRCRKGLCSDERV